MGGEITGQNAPDQLNNWYSPTFGTPDYLATNGTQIDVRPQEENGVAGSSTPYSGTGEIGLYSRQQYSDAGGSRARVSEYVTEKLPNALIVGAQYYAEMRTSLSHSKNPCNYGIMSGFGMWFSNDNNFQTTSSRDFLPALSPDANRIFNASPIGQNALNNGNLGSTTWQRISGQITGKGEQYVTLGLFNSDPNNLIPLPNNTSGRFNTYIFIDNFQLYKIPTAGLSTSVSCGVQAIIGEGCAIPGATYAWTVQGNSAAPFSTSLQTTVPNRLNDTYYVLTVTLPDNSKYASIVKVTGANTLAQVVIKQTDAQPCYNTFSYTITNFNPDNTYTITYDQTLVLTSGNSTGPGAGTITRNVFAFKGKTRTTQGSFILTASNCKQQKSSVGDNLVYGSCDTSVQPVSILLAYPNPAFELIEIPIGTDNAILFDALGNVVQKAGDKGKLDVNSLSNGLYNLRMQQGGKTVNQRIQVQH